MRLFNYSIGFFVLVAIICFAFIEVTGHRPRSVELEVANYNGPLKNAVRVYAGPSLREFKEFSILAENFKFEILNVHSFALGVDQNVTIKRAIVDGSPLTWKFHRNGFTIAKIAEGDVHVRPTNLKLSKLLACLILAFFAAFLFWCLGKPFEPDTSLKELAPRLGKYTAVLLPIVFYAYIFSPALYDYDFPDSLRHASKYGLSGWFSFINYIVLGAGIIIGKVTGLGLKAHMIVQTTCFFIGACFYTELLSKAKTRRSALPIFIALLWLAPFVLFSVQISRDFWTTFLPVVASLGVVFLRFEKRPVSWPWTLISLAMGIACLYRPELILGATALIFAIYWLKNFKSAIISAAIVLSFFIAGLAINNKIDPKASRTKLISSLSQPLGAVLTSSAPNISHQEWQELKKYMDIEMVIKKHVDNEIAPFHAGAFYTEKILKNLNNYLKLNFVIFLKNPGVTLRSRLLLFGKLLGVRGRASGYPDDHYYRWNNKNKNIVGLVDWNIRKRPTSYLRHKIISSQNGRLAWFYCMAPSILICLWALFLIEKIRPAP